MKITDKDFSSNKIVSFSELKGKIIERIIINECTNEKPFDTTDAVVFYTNEGIYALYHDQDCCESVNLEEVIGELDDIMNSPVLIANEIINDSNSGENSDDYNDSCTWTFYNISTVKGHVTLRFFGVSNGYYSERVSLYKL
jgi:hypothetical protein